jgi:hypothetical protein
MVVFVAPVQVGGTVPIPIEPGQTPVDGPVVGQAMALAQAPQLSVPPQPSPIVPQYWPPIGVQVIGLQVGSLQTSATLAPQVPPFGQLPQSSVPPQPSPMLPQKRALLAPLQVRGTHPGETQTPP